MGIINPVSLTVMMVKQNSGHQEFNASGLLQGSVNASPPSNILYCDLFTRSLQRLNELLSYNCGKEDFSQSASSV
jgi:hypothetical protein